MKTLYILPILLLTVSCSILPAKKIHISVDGDDLHPGTKSQPLQSLEAAQLAVRKIRADKPERSIRVILGEGTWHPDRSLGFASADGGAEKVTVTWEGRKDGKTVISGGRVITGFRDEGYGLWWAAVEPGFAFEQLYIDGKHATRARIPNATDSIPQIYLNNCSWIYNPDSTVKNITMSVRDRGLFQDINTVGEFEAVVFKEWTVSRFHATALNPDPAELYLKPPFILFQGSFISIFSKHANTYSCYLEGNPGFIDQPGEWALDLAGSRLYYKPLPGQSIDGIKVVAPFTEQLLILKGTRNQPVQNLEFRNISFEHGAYRLPEFNHDGVQAGFYYTGSVEPAANLGLVPPGIQLSWAENCRITGCRLTHSGGNGIYLMEGCRNNRIEQVFIEDIGGCGIMIGLTFDPADDSLQLPVNNTVNSCTVHLAGVAFHGSVGIWLGFGAGNEISGSEIYDLPYTGISVGWQWNPLPTSSKGNRILNNKIHHAMQVLGDGGGIYTLGYQPGSVIAGNEIHDILRSGLNHASPNNGMFIDEGSKGYRIENNTIRNTAHTCIRGHRAAGVELIGNTFYTSSLPAISHTPPYDAMIYANQDTTISWPNPGWPKEWGYEGRVTAFTMHNNKYLK